MSYIKIYITIAFCFAWLPCSADDHPYIAFSLREAQRILQQGNQNEQLQSLGGMRRIVGMVYDSTGNDVILIGRELEYLPEACFDDLIVALRARLLHDEWPMVSIDPTDETQRTGIQQVNFRGGIAGSGFGWVFFACDTLLKNYSLELMQTIHSVPSYQSLCFKKIKQEIERNGSRVTRVHWTVPDSSQALHGKHILMEESYQTRFWFFPLEPFRFVARDGIFCIKDLRLSVVTQLDYAKRDSNAQLSDSLSIVEAGKEFAKRFTERFPELTKTYPLLRRLKLLYDLVAVAEGIKNLPRRPDLTYFLTKYLVAPVRQRNEYDVVQRFAVLERSDEQQHIVNISGGIEFRTELKWLNYGDVTPLRSVVIKARPKSSALVWRIPALEDWRMPNGSDLPPDDSISISLQAQWNGNKKNIGFSICTQSYLLAPSGNQSSVPSRIFPGFTPLFQLPPKIGIVPRIYYDQCLGGIDIAPDPKGEVKKMKRLKDQIMQSRPSNDSVYFPIKLF